MSLMLQVQQTVKLGLGTVNYPPLRVDYSDRLPIYLSVGLGYFNRRVVL